MAHVTFINSPQAHQSQPIVDGVVAYGESLVKGNTPEKYAFHLIQGDQLIGGILGAKQYNRFYLSHIWVSEKYRNNGFGSLLLKDCEKTVKRLGCSSIILETLNKKAVDFYIKNGFSPISEICEYIQGFDLVYLLKELDS